MTVQPNDGLVDALLAIPAAPPVKFDPEKQFTSQIEISGDNVMATIRGPIGMDADSVAAELLREEGLDPREFDITSCRISKWTMTNGEDGKSCRYSFRRTGIPLVDIDELIAVIDKAEERGFPAFTGAPISEQGLIVAIGDMQFGKVDGDGVAGTLKRTLDCIDQAAERARKTYYPHIHLAWLGDHVEGFVSQRGANVWRTPLTLSEQTRLVRRVMAYAVNAFAPLTARLSVVAVPGNHGETVRIQGKGVTRYDDSHDTEALVAVSEAYQGRAAFDHVEFYTPEPDEMTVILEVAGTVIGHVHGHQWRPGKHFDWWKGQAFSGPLAAADVLLAGHLHHTLIEGDGPRMFIQVPSMESESTWYRHATGTVGDPGLLACTVKDGHVLRIEVIR